MWFFFDFYKCYFIFEVQVLLLSSFFLESIRLLEIEISYIDPKLKIESFTSLSASIVSGFIEFPRIPIMNVFMEKLLFLCTTSMRKNITVLNKDSNNCYFAEPNSLIIFYFIEIMKVSTSKEP